MLDWIKNLLKTPQQDLEYNDQPFEVYGDKVIGYTAVDPRTRLRSGFGHKTPEGAMKELYDQLHPNN